MNYAPKTRNRIGLTPFEWKPNLAYQRSLGPFVTYREHEPDLVQLLENDCRMLWRECAPIYVPEEYRGLRATAHDELWENHPDNGVGSSYDRKDKGYQDAPQYVTPVSIEKQKARLRQARIDAFAEKFIDDEMKRDFYPDKIFP